MISYAHRARRSSGACSGADKITVHCMLPLVPLASSGYPAGSSTRENALVQLGAGTNGIKLPYQASLFAAHQRMKETGALTTADHVLLTCSEVVTHPDVKLLRFNCTEIDEACRDKGLNGPAMYRIAAFRLVMYRRVLMLDLDSYIAADISGIFQLPAPGMVRWESPVAGPNQPNGGVHYVAPSEALYTAALGWIRRLPVGSANRRKALLYEMQTPWGAFNNRSKAIAPNPGLVLAGDSDQHFFFMLYNVLERERFGPLHELPYEYNVKHYVLSQKQWSAKAYLTFMSRPEQGFIRILHFNRDKPWEGAQCGPYQHAFWHAARRGLTELSAAGRTPAIAGLDAYVREGMRHEDAKPCVVGEKTAGVHVATKRLEQIMRDGELKSLPKTSLVHLAAHGAKAKSWTKKNRTKASRKTRG